MLPLWVAARTVMVSSPKREVYKVRGEASECRRTDAMAVQYGGGGGAAVLIPSLVGDYVNALLTNKFSMPLHVQEWIKGRPHIVMTMPQWTRSEMRVLWEVLYSDKVGPVRSCGQRLAWNHFAIPPHSYNPSAP